MVSVTETRVRRPRRKTLTDKGVLALPRRPDRYFHPDPEMPGHGVRVLPDGPSSFYAIARDAHRKQRWVRIGGTAELSIADSRERAREVLKRLRAGLEPFEAPAVKPDTVADVVATWVRRHVEAKGLRTGDELKRVLERHVLPAMRDRVFAEIKRSDIARLLDAVEDRHGVWVADSVLSALRAVASWYATRNDEYTPPFVKRMRRVPEQERKRSRTLNDVELSKFWIAAEADPGPYGAFVRVAVLTGQRREKLAGMKWDDFADDVWKIPSAPREKGTPHSLRLPALALDIIRAQPRFAGSPFVFTGRNNGPLVGVSRRHAALKAQCGVDGFTVHDLRRVCRSLLSRAGVAPNIAERVLGHSVGGIQAVYDRHGYDDEMAEALCRLAALVERIVHPAGGNVVSLRAPTVQP